SSRRCSSRRRSGCGRRRPSSGRSSSTAAKAGAATSATGSRSCTAARSPPVLWAMEAGIPIDGDGRILFEAFEPDFATTQPVREVDEPFVAFQELADSDASEVSRRLRELGYI